MTSTYTPSLPKPGINFEYKPAPMTREDVAIALLRTMNGAAVSGNAFETILSVLGRLADEHAKAWPEFDMEKACEAIDVAADLWRSVCLPDEPAAVLHQERADAALMGGCAVSAEHTFLAFSVAVLTLLKAELQRIADDVAQLEA